MSSDEIERAQKLITELAKEGGVGVGDVIAMLTKWAGVKNQCAPCLKRQAWLDKLRLYGWKVKWVDIKPK